MSRRTYTDDEKAHALALYAEHGKAEAARMTGIAAGTIGAWASRAGVATGAADNLRAATAVAAAKRTFDAETFRTEMVAKLAEVARKAAAKELELITKSDLRSVVGSRTRAIHDLQLLSGDPTARTETVAKDSLDREIERLFEHAS